MNAMTGWLNRTRTLLLFIAIAGVLFFGSILFILSRAPRP